MTPQPKHQPPRWVAAPNPHAQRQLGSLGSWYIYNATNRRTIAVGLEEQYAKEIVDEHNGVFEAEGVPV